eukprot:3933065-Rhodomonas_salina.2
MSLPSARLSGLEDRSWGDRSFLGRTALTMVGPAAQLSPFTAPAEQEPVCSRPASTLGSSSGDGGADSAPAGEETPGTETTSGGSARCCPAVGVNTPGAPVFTRSKATQSRNQRASVVSKRIGLSCLRLCDSRGPAQRTRSSPAPGGRQRRLSCLHAHGVVDFDYAKLEMEPNVHPMTPLGRDVSDEMYPVVVSSLEHSQHSVTLCPEPASGKKVYPAMAGLGLQRKQAVGSRRLNCHQSQEGIDNVVTDHGAGGQA